MKIHLLTFPDIDSKEYIAARYHYLLQIVFGETVAIDYCKRIATFAPNEEAKNFLLQQQLEEDIHLEILTDYITIHSRPQVAISPYLKKLDQIMAEKIMQRDYVESIFVQNFIVEGLNVSLLQELEHHGDGELSELCTRILNDEVRHMEFGVEELKRILENDKDKIIVKKLIRLQRKTLLYATLLATSIARESKKLGIPINEFAKETVNAHFERITQAQFPLPLLDKLAFRFVIVFLRFF